MTIKRIFFLMVALAALVSSPAFSKDRVAVLDFEAKDVEESDALAIADFFRSDLVATGKFIVLERGNMQSILDEHQLQMKGLTNDASASEIGELLAVNYLFLGNLSKFGSKFILVIDKINVETGEIENSVKKNAVNLDSFLELSSEIAEELTGSDIISDAEATAAGAYNAATLTELVSSIGFFNLINFRSVDFDTVKMQTTELNMRKEVLKEFELDNSVLAAIVNAVTFGIGGNFMQGFDELAWTSVATTGAFAASLLFSNSLGLQIITGLLYTTTYVTGVISPFQYEANYNQYLRDTLLVY